MRMEDHNKLWTAKRTHATNDSPEFLFSLHLKASIKWKSGRKVLIVATEITAWTKIHLLQHVHISDLSKHKIHKVKIHYRHEFYIKHRTMQMKSVRNIKECQPKFQFLIKLNRKNWQIWYLNFFKCIFHT